MKPSELIQRAIRGEPIEDEAVKSWLRFFVHKKACAILDLPREQRLNAIEVEPLSEAVKAEVIRVFEYRKTTCRKEFTKSRTYTTRR